MIPLLNKGPSPSFLVTPGAVRNADRVNQH